MHNDVCQIINFLAEASRLQSETAQRDDKLPYEDMLVVFGMYIGKPFSTIL